MQKDLFSLILGPSQRMRLRERYELLVKQLRKADSPMDDGELKKLLLKQIRGQERKRRKCLEAAANAAITPLDNFFQENEGTEVVLQHVELNGRRYGLICFRDNELAIVDLIKEVKKAVETIAIESIHQNNLQ